MTKGQVLILSTGRGYVREKSDLCIMKPRDMNKALFIQTVMKVPETTRLCGRSTSVDINGE